MNHTKQFIEDAIAGGGIDFDGYFTDCDKEDVLDSIHRVLLDPTAWRAVGKTRGWDKGWLGAEDWKTEWSIFIDHLADGKTIEEALAAISE